MPLTLDLGLNVPDVGGRRSLVNWTAGQPLPLGTTSARTGLGMFFDANGIARNNAHNLALWSEDFTNAAWNGASVGATVAADQAVAPDGNTTADRIDFASGDFRYQNYASGALVGRTATYSCWVWSPSKAKIILRLTDSGGTEDTRTVVNLTAGATRVYATKSFTGVGTGLQIGFDNRVAVGGDGLAGFIYVWGAQLEMNASASDYQKTTNAAVYATRNAHYIGGKPRTNLALWSQDFTNAAWTLAASVTATPNAAAAPDGTNTATKIDWSAGVTGQGVIATNNVAVSPITANTKSIWIRADVAGGTASLRDGSVTIGNTIITLTTSWQRVSLSEVQAGGTARIWLQKRADSPSVVYIWGAQHENDPAMSAYIATTNAIVTVFDGASPYWLLEGVARTNSVLWSRDLTSAPWLGAATVALNATGLDGTSNSAATLTDNSAAAFQERDQTWTVVNDNSTHAATVWFRKDTDQTRFPGVIFRLAVGATPVNRTVHLNTQTGAIATQASAGTSTVRVSDAGLWWAVEITLTNNTSGHTTLVLEVYPAMATVIGTNNAAAVGSCVVGNVQVELNSTFGSSPIFTTSAAVPRTADVATVPFAYQEAPTTGYVKYIDLGTQLSGQSLIGIGDDGVRPTLYMQATSSTNMRSSFHNGTAQVSSTSFVTGIVIGDLCEARVTLDAAGSTNFGLTRNNGAETIAAASSGQALGAGWGGSKVVLNDRGGGFAGFIALAAVKVVNGNQSRDAMRAA